MRISLIALGDIGEALLLRALLEHLGHRIDLFPVGKPSDFFKALSEAADIAVISGHGDEAGFVFPEMAPGVDTLVLPTNRITPEILSQHLVYAPKILISTACDSGRTPIVSAFHTAGCGLYIAPKDYPFATTIPLSLGLAIYHADAGKPWAEAIDLANANLPTADRFSIFPTD